jgi:hypothetical protein
MFVQVMDVFHLGLMMRHLIMSSLMASELIEKVTIG